MFIIFFFWKRKSIGVFLSLHPSHVSQLESAKVTRHWLWHLQLWSCFFCFWSLVALPWCFLPYSFSIKENAFSFVLWLSSCKYSCFVKLVHQWASIPIPYLNKMNPTIYLDHLIDVYRSLNKGVVSYWKYLDKVYSYVNCKCITLLKQLGRMFPIYWGDRGSRVTNPIGVIKKPLEAQRSVLNLLGMYFFSEERVYLSIVSFFSQCTWMIKLD